MIYFIDLLNYKLFKKNKIVYNADQTGFELCTIYFIPRLDMFGSGSDPWSIFANKNILSLNRVKIKVINNTITSISNFALPNDRNQ